MTPRQYIMEYYMKRIVNLQSVIEKCNGTLTHTTTRIMKSIKKEDHLLKVLLEYGFEWTASSIPRSLGRLRKKRKRSKLKDEPYVKDGKLRKRGRSITCQSCGNTGHNKEPYKGQGLKSTTGSNIAEASGSVSGQVEHVFGQDGSSGSGESSVVGQCGRVGVGVGSRSTSLFSFPMQLTETRNAYGREMCDGILTQSSAAAGASEWAIL
ncbi:hypothetical protein Tco_0565065 [Tanacetum coccineum]